MTTAAWRLNGSWLLIRAVATALILLYIGPFGREAELSRIAHDKADSPWQQLYAGAQEARIAIVLLDDRDIKDLGGQWPLPYAHWAQVLRRLGCAQAEAVFFDLLFGNPEEFARSGAPGRPGFREIDERVRLGKLTAADCPGQSTAPAPMPVGYAYADRPDDWLPKVVDAARKLPIKWRGAGDDYPLLIDDGQGARRESPAYFLFLTSCAKGMQAPGCHAQPDADDLEQDLVPMWSQRVPHLHDLWFKEQCPNRTPQGPGDALWRWLRSLWDPPQPTPCWPFLTFSVKQLMDGFDAEMAFALKGRLVLVGASISGARDLSQTSTHGQLPAVFLHATALENLLSHGGQFHRIDGRAIMLATLLAIVLASLAHLGASALLSPTQLPYRHPVAQFWLVVVTFLVIAAAFHGVLRMPPGMITSAAFTMSLGLLLGELSTEGTWYGYIMKLRPELPLPR